MAARSNDQGIVKKIKTSRKPASKPPKSKEEGSTTILYRIGASAPKRNRLHMCGQDMV
nr:MAG TPA: hypothetical protein [Caudoviricetes sp.]